MPEKFHPITGARLHPLGVTKRGRLIWPILGGSGPVGGGGGTGSTGTATGTDAGQTGGTGGTGTGGASTTGTGNPGDGGETGFPANTPVTQMTEAQQAAYWKHQSRKHEDRAGAYGGLTPEQVTAMQQRVTELENANRTEAERAIEAAKVEARTAADSEWKPKLAAAHLKAAAGTVLTDKDQLNAFLSIAKPEAFTNEAGEIDADKVVAHLEKLYPKGREYGSGVPQHRDWGQSGARPSGQSGIEQGKAMAAKRHPTKPTP